MENADAVYTNTVELAGALADDGYILNLETEYLAEIGFETEFVENLPPSEEEEKEQEAENAATLDKIARYIIAGIVGLAGSIASFFMLRKTIKNEQLTILKKQIQKPTKAKTKHPISPETARKRLIVFAAADIALVAGCIALAIHMAPKIQEKQNDPDIHLMSGNADFDNGEAGAWQLSKSAKWIGDGKAEVTMTIDTKKKTSDKKKDIVFAVDVSGSMMGNKLDQVKADMTEVVADVLNDSENQVSLISFESTANLELPFTSDKELTLSAIENLETGNNTNYYEALQRVEEALAGHTQDENRELYVLILTDGFPTVDSPNEVREFQYLKELYPYATFGAIQYEMGSSSVYDPITRISDEQFIADMSSLHNTLFDVVAFPFTYATMDITDYINTDYFALDEDREIEASLGEATAQDNTISWTLGGKLRSGDSATITIPIKLKEELRRTAGEYPTNAKETVLSDIYEVGEDEQTSTESPVLKNNYTVTYEANAPEGCTVSGLPASESHFVYQVTEISDTVPTCPGYNFAGYTITTEDVYRLNSDYFRMPVSDVTIKATWVKASIEKTMDGTVYEGMKLYNEIAKKTNGLDSAIDFSEASSTTNGEGVNTVASTANDDYPVHYFRGNVTDNNVLFANSCWKAVRTTETGGVKLIYNGAPNAGGQCINTVVNESGVIDIGREDFNPSYNNPAYAGYMYGGTYKINSRYHTSRENPINSGTLRLDRWYADSAEYDSTIRAWRLVDAYKVNSVDDYANLENKYTFFSTEQNATASSVQYITGISNDTYYYFELGRGYSLETNNWLYTYGESYTDNGDGSFTINNPTTIRRGKYYEKYEEMKNKYLCKNAVNDSCSEVWLVNSISNIYTLVYSVPFKYNYLYSDGFSYDGSQYMLNSENAERIWNLDDSREREKINNAHYTCFNESGQCEKISYVYYVGCRTTTYIGQCLSKSVELSEGNTIESEINRMNTNKIDSVIKSRIDQWYETNIEGTPSAQLLEDTVFCNDRSMGTGTNGWISNGGRVSEFLTFGAYNRNNKTNEPNLACPSPNDSFTVTASLGNGALTYPIGLLSEDELVLAGLGTSDKIRDNNNFLYSGQQSWTMSPFYFTSDELNYYSWFDHSTVYYIRVGSNKGAVRPVVSVKPGIAIAVGDGSKEHPWELELP